MFGNQSLNFKLRAGFSSIIFFLLIVGLASFAGIKMISEKYDHVVSINLQNAITLSTMEAGSREALRRLLQFELKGNSEEDNKRIDQAITDSLAKYEAGAKKYEDVTFVPGESELYDKVSGNWKELVVHIGKARELAKSQLEGDRIKFSDLYKTDMKKSRDGFFEALEKLVNFQTEQSKIWTEEAQRAARTANTVCLTALIAGILLAAVTAIRLSKALSLQLRTIATSLADRAIDVESASVQIAAASEELSQATVEQSSSLEETSASVEEISSMINLNAEGAKLSVEITNDSLAQAEKGKKVVGQMIEAIDNISDSNNKIMSQINESNNEIENIVKLITEIGDKTKVINEIVFQTKLLSFNASVEAARAGENGKGFAVVAEEVGNLAEMSGNAAKEITSMLDDGISKVKAIVKNNKEKVEGLISDGKAKIDFGTNVANQCGGVLNEIVHSVESVSKKSQEIAKASEEQAQGVFEITKAMGQLDQVTQQNTATTAESANAASALARQAESLNTLVNELIVTIEGKSGADRIEKKEVKKKEPAKTSRLKGTPLHDSPHFVDT
jgi:methyl-accepting chemotaxis protein